MVAFTGYVEFIRLTHEIRLGGGINGRFYKGSFFKMPPPLDFQSFFSVLGWFWGCGRVLRVRVNAKSRFTTKTSTIRSMSYLG